MRLRQIYIFIAMIVAGLAVQAVLASPATAALYIAQGTATSTNLLSGSSASSIDNFHYNIATLPATSSVRIQFSKDNATWYSSAGAPGGWDTLALGQADLSLAAFVAASAWTNGNPFYYKLEINSTADLSATPTIDDIRLDYTPVSGYENVFVFDNFGNVGIGTTSPSGKLDIHGAGTATGINTQWSDLTGAAKVSILDNGNVGIGTTLPSQLFQVNNSGSTAFVVTSGGNVGIGNTSPGAKLEINNANNWGAPVTSGAIQTYGTFRTRTGGGVLDIGALANGSTWLQAGEATALGTNYHLLLQPNGGNVGIGTTAPTNLLDVAGGMKIGAGYAGIGTTAPVNGLLVQGNVGIGTTGPGAKLVINSNTAVPAVVGTDTVLQIVGGAAANSRIENNAFGGYAAFLGRRADGTSAVPTAVQANEIISRLDARGYGATGYSSAPRAMIDLIAGENWTDSAQGGYLSFSTTLNGGIITSEKVRIDNAGNVGIGTTSPSALLDVNGSTWLRGVAGGTSGLYVNTGGNVGIGTTSPKSKLAVSGGIGIGTTAPGSSYLSTKAPDGGLIVEGSVGIGTTAPGQELDVNGQIRYVDAVGDNLTYVCKNSAGDLANCVSLEKYKNDVTNLDAGLDTLKQLRPVKFKWDSSGKYDLGFIAEEVQEVNPLLAIYDEKGNLSGVKYPQLTALLTKAVQEQQAQIADVNTQVGDLNLRTSQNVETVGQLQKSVDDNLTVISSNFSAVDTKLALHDSQMANVNSQLASIGTEVSNINFHLTSLDTQTSAIVSQVSALNGNMSLNKAEKADLEARLTAAETKLKDQENNLGNMENKFLKELNTAYELLNGNDKLLNSRMDALEAKVATLSVSATGEIPANVITQDALGNATLAGLFKAKQIETGGVVAGSYEVKNADPEKKTMGDATICEAGKIFKAEIEKCATPSAEEIAIASDGKKIEIKTNAVSDTAKIFVTPEGDAGGRVWVEKTKVDGKLTGSFSVNISEAVKKDTKFSWWIVEEK